MPSREHDGTGNALAFVTAEQNDDSWLEGGFYGVASSKPRLQELAGNGGTVWVVVSRPHPDGGRMYTISMRLENCASKISRIDPETNEPRLFDAPLVKPFADWKPSRFGEYVVRGNVLQSKLIAANDAKLLLMSLRFVPFKPLKGPSPASISNSLRPSRELSEDDVQLLKEYADLADRWSVFISYKSEDSYRGEICGTLDMAGALSDFLQAYGVNVFRDKEKLRAGDKWPEVLKLAVERARCVVLLIGAHTHESDWVRREIDHARQKDVRVIPVLFRGNVKQWATQSEIKLASVHAVKAADMDDTDVFKKILRDLPGPKLS